MHPALDTLLRSLAFLLLCAALFGTLEKGWPLRAQAFFRPRWMLDAAYALWSPLLVALGLGVTLPLLRAGVAAWVPAWVAQTAAQQSVLFLGVQVFLLMEVTLYAVHRAQHCVPMLWRLHSVHHSSTTMDWLASQRQHPVESIVTLTLAAIPGLVLGFPLAPLLGLVLLQKLHAVWVHANVVLPQGGWERVVTAPRFHHWHHDGDSLQPGNYAATLAVLDALFGTLRLPPGHPRRHGVFPRPRPTLWERTFHG